VADFTSSLYLGMQHPASSLPPWTRLTQGAPAALHEAAGVAAVTAQLAQLQGCEQATLAKSTLHLFWDLFGVLAGERIAVFLDAGAYPTARWGVERAVGKGVPLQLFAHKDSAALARLLRRVESGRRVVIVTDGICSCCGCAAPLRVYLDLVRRVGGLLVLDDTQALGLLGRRPGPRAPYGHGGGGSLRWAGLQGPDVLVVSSLAKAFGAPLAVLAGSRDAVTQYVAQSETRLHCSPPAATDVLAAQSALAQNARTGDVLRQQLAQRVRYLRQRLAEVGLTTSGGLFPVQTILLPSRHNPKILNEQLRQQDVQVILRRVQEPGAVGLSMILTARHSLAEIDHAVQILTQLLPRTGDRSMPPRQVGAASAETELNLDGP
jgi:8-amino-7-oxononanoate synthase